MSTKTIWKSKNKFTTLVVLLFVYRCVLNWKNQKIIISLRNIYDLILEYILCSSQAIEINNVECAFSYLFSLSKLSLSYHYGCES